MARKPECSCFLAHAYPRMIHPRTLDLSCLASELNAPNHNAQNKKARSIPTRITHRNQTGPRSMAASSPVPVYVLPCPMARAGFRLRCGRQLNSPTAPGKRFAGLPTRSTFSEYKSIPTTFDAKCKSKVASTPTFSGLFYDLQKTCSHVTLKNTLQTATIA
jgi:hypothetical protein